MALGNYARLPVFYNGAYLKQITSVSMKTDSGQQAVNLLNEGLGGFTPGSGNVTIDLGFAIPIGGTEVEYQQDSVAGNFVVLQVGVGKVSYIGTGKILNVDMGQSTGANAEGSCSWMGELKALE